MTDDSRSLMASEGQKPIAARAKTVFSDHDGNMSSMRVMAFLSFLTAAALALLPMFGLASKVDQNLILYFLAAAFGGKSLQKFAEKSR